MFNWLIEKFRSQRAKGDIFFGVPKTVVLFDLLTLRNTQSAILGELAERQVLPDDHAESVRRYLRSITKARSANLIVTQFRQSLRRESTPRFTLDLRPGFAAVIEPFEERNLAVVTELELPEKSPGLIQAEQGLGKRAAIADLLDFQVVDSKWPLAIYCHICMGSGRVDCKRCEGRGWYRSRSGKKRPCGGEGCKGGKKPCYYCHGEKYRGCGLLHNKQSFTISLPEEIRGIPDLPIFVNKQRLNIGANLLFSAALNIKLHSPATPDTDTLLTREAAFNEECREMHRFLLLEVEAETAEFSAIRITDGRFTETNRANSRPSLAFKALGVVPAWTAEERLLLVAPAESLVYQVSFLGAKEQEILVSIKEWLETGDRISASGFLIAGEGLIIFQAQTRALQFWSEASATLHPIKRALCQPEHLPEYPSPNITKFFNPSIAENLPQREAVEKAINPSRALHLIQGPPGTGKTSVITEIVAQHLRRGGKRVLISSQANLAVDNVLERLAEIPGISMLRMGRKERVQSELHPYLLESKLAGIEAREKGNVARSIIAGTQVVGATCIGSDHRYLRPEEPSSLQADPPFDLVIVDEAGRGTPMETFVPLRLGSRAVLVGDHKQLPPVLSAALRETWISHTQGKELEQSIGAISLFEKLLRRVPADSLSVLNRQFRMHPQIGDFIGKVFYPDEKLENGISAKARALPLPGFPAAFSYHSTKSFGEQRFEITARGSSSKENPAEAELIVGLIGLLDEVVHHSEHGKIRPSVGVICFYSAQVERLRRMLQNCRLESLDFRPTEDVATLDSFQGKEKDIVLLSMVRCPRDAQRFNAEWYQFFLDVRRLNVALSRAKRRLLVVGDLEQILRVEKNRENVEGFEVLERLRDYIYENRLEVSAFGT